MLAALGAAVVMVLLALPEPCPVRAKPAGDLALQRQIFEVFLVAFPGIAAQHTEIAVPQRDEPQPVQQWAEQSAQNHQQQGTKRQKTAKTVKPVPARHKTLEPASHT